MKQTAVEFLASELRNHIDMPFKHFDELFEQAKEMEKQQIIDAFHKHSQKIYCEEEAEQYYNQTFNK